MSDNGKLKQGFVKLGGKQYLQVNARVKWFREDHPHGVITTEVVSWEPLGVKASIYDNEGSLIAVDHGSAVTKPNTVWAGRELEKACTAAIGRALALAGYGTLNALKEDVEDNHLSDSPVEPPTPQGDRDRTHDRQRLNGSDAPNRVGGDREPDDPLDRPWTVETLKPAVLHLFDHERNYYAAVKNYRDPAHAEYLLPADVSLAEAEARVRLYRSRTDKANQHLFNDGAVAEAFTNASLDIVEDEQGIIEALDAVADYPVAHLVDWRGDKATAWAAVLAAGGLYVERAAIPESAGAVTRALVRLICERVAGQNADAAQAKKHVAFNDI